jgi:hypothetical protein
VAQELLGGWPPKAVRLLVLRGEIANDFAQKRSGYG